MECIRYYRQVTALYTDRKATLGGSISSCKLRVFSQVIGAPGAFTRTYRDHAPAEHPGSLTADCYAFTFRNACVPIPEALALSLSTFLSSKRPPLHFRMRACFKCPRERIFREKS